MDLPADLALPLDRGAGWWYWLGGRPALDFVNTLRERWWRRVETLVTPEDLGEWLVSAGLADDPPATDRELLESARSLREAIAEAADAVLAERPAAPDDLSTISSWLADAGVPDVLRLDGDVPRLGTGVPDDPARHALGRVAADAAALLGTDQRDRLRVCASETCSARFYDRSPAGHRRWCSMQGCGNSAKARRHQARRKDDGAS